MFYDVGEHECGCRRLIASNNSDRKRSLPAHQPQRSYKPWRRNRLSLFCPHPVLLVLVTSAFSAIKHSTIATSLRAAARCIGVFPSLSSTLLITAAALDTGRSTAAVGMSL